MEKAKPNTYQILCQSTHHPQGHQNYINRNKQVSYNTTTNFCLSFFKQSNMRASTDKRPTQLLYQNALGSWWCFSLLLFCHSSVQSEWDVGSILAKTTTYKQTKKKKKHVANSFCKIFQCWAVFHSKWLTYLLASVLKDQIHLPKKIHEYSAENPTDTV